MDTIISMSGKKNRESHGKSLGKIFKFCPKRKQFLFGTRIGLYFYNRKAVKFKGWESSVF